LGSVFSPDAKKDDSKDDGQDAGRTHVDHHLRWVSVNAFDVSPLKELEFWPHGNVLRILQWWWWWLFFSNEWVGGGKFQEPLWRFAKKSLGFEFLHFMDLRDVQDPIGRILVGRERKS
jgi:hypothetical protein